MMYAKTRDCPTTLVLSAILGDPSRKHKCGDDERLIPRRGLVQASPHPGSIKKKLPLSPTLAIVPRQNQSKSLEAEERPLPIATLRFSECKCQGSGILGQVVDALIVCLCAPVSEGMTMPT